MGLSIFGSEEDHVLSCNINSFRFSFFELLRMEGHIPSIWVRRQGFSHFLFFCIISWFDDELSFSVFAVIDSIKDDRNQSYCKSGVRHREAEILIIEGETVGRGVDS